MHSYALLPEIMSSVTRAFLIGKVHSSTTQDMNEFGRSFPQPAHGTQLLIDQVSGYLSTSDCHYSICIHPICNRCHYSAGLIGRPPMSSVISRDCKNCST